MKNLCLVLSALWAVTLSVSAQGTFVYNGRVINSSGLPLKDVAVKGLNTNTSSTTGADGLFSLTLPAGGDSVVFDKEGLATYGLRVPFRRNDVIALGTLNGSCMSVREYAKRMLETAQKYYESGLQFLSGETPDYMKAYACFTRAANMEYTRGAYYLAKMYDEGIGIPQDYAQAIKWYKKAPSSQKANLRLGIMYLEGIGTEPNNILARQHLYTAISQGDTTMAQKLLDELYAKQPELAAEGDDRVYEMVEVNAQFPGGEDECYNFLAENVRYPAICQKQGVQGRVIVSFVVDRDGTIQDVKAVRSPDPNLAKEAVRVVSLMPKWVPAMQGGKNVRSCFNLPVMFRLN